MRAGLPIVAMLCLASGGWFSGLAAAQTAAAHGARAAAGALPVGVSGEQQTTNAAAAAPAAGQEMLQAALRTIQSRDTISAKVRYRVDLFGQQLVGSGSYLQQRRNPIDQVRLDLRIQLGDEVTSLLRVCDGHDLWTYRKFLDEESLSRIDVGRAWGAIQPGATVPWGRQPQPLPHFGGIPRLVSGLAESFQFGAVENGWLGQLRVWIIRGQWRPNRLAELLPDEKDAIEKGLPPRLEKLPPQLPDHVILLLGQDDLFPYRIEYHRQTPPEKQAGDATSGRPILILDLLEVSFNAPIDHRQFIYRPGNVKYTDETVAFIKRLRDGK